MSDPLPWEEDLAAAGELTSEVVQTILNVHGDRGSRAIEAVHEGRVKEYRDFVVVVGHEDEYVVEGAACTCLDARYNLDPDDPTDQCWHAVAAQIATTIGTVDSYDLWYSDLRDLV